MALPGVLTLLSALAVLLGTPPPAHPPQPRITALASAPGLPELRAAPLPPLPAPLPGAPPPAVWAMPPRADLRVFSFALWTPPAPRPALAWWGRRQTDGG